MDAKRLIEKMRNEGFNEAWIAYNSGVAQSTINRIRRSEGFSCRVDTFFRIKKAFMKSKSIQARARC